MKKIIAAVLLICLLFTGCLSVYQVKAMAARAAEEEAANAYVPPAPTIRTVDFDALYRSHDPEEIVCTVNDEPVSWEEYFYFYSSYALQIENTMAAYSQVGLTMSWEDPFEEETGRTWSDVPPEYARRDVMEYRNILLYAKDNNLEMTPELNEELSNQIMEAAESALGENATEEDFAAYLKQGYLPFDLYKRMLTASLMYRNLFSNLYGDPAELEQSGNLESSQADLSARLEKNLEKISLIFSENFREPKITDYLVEN